MSVGLNVIMVVLGSSLSFTGDFDILTLWSPLPA